MASKESSSSGGMASKAQLIGSNENGSGSWLMAK